MKSLLTTFLFIFLLTFVCYNTIQSQNKRLATEEKTSAAFLPVPIPFQAARETNGSFATTVYTFGDVTVFSYFDNTIISIYDASNTLMDTKTLNVDTYHTFSLSSGVYRIDGNKTYTVLVGDAISYSVNGYFAIDEAGRAISTKLNTWMSQDWWGSDDDFIIFAYQNSTGFTVKNLETGALLAAGTLNAGEHYSFKNAGNVPFQTPLQVIGTKPISALSYEDQDYYVPASNGTFVGTLFYGFSAYNGSWTNSITITSYTENNTVTITNTSTGENIATVTLGLGEVYSTGIYSPTFWTVSSTGNISAANIPFYGWSGSYSYMTRAIDQSGKGFGTLFYVPTINSNIHVFSFEAGNSVTITKLGNYEDYPYANPQNVWTGTLGEGEYYTFDSEWGNFVYKIESSKNVSVLQSYNQAGADFMPLAYSLDYPDLAISLGDIGYSKFDTDINAGDLITVTVTVHNYGNVGASNVNCIAYEGDPDLGGNAPPIGSGLITSIAAGGSGSFQFSYRVPTSPEYRFIVVKVDPTNIVIESNESNNKANRSIKPNNELLPPIAVTVNAPSSLSLSGGVLTPNPFTVQYDLFNTGYVSADNVQVTLELFGGLTLASGSQIINVGSIAANTTQSVEFQISANANVPGFNLYRITITATGLETKIVSRTINVPDAVPPAAPSNFAGSFSGSGCASFSWNGNLETDFAGYYLYYGTDGVNWNGTGAVQGDSPILIVGEDTFEICGFSSGTYYFMLRAFDSSNNMSSISTIVQINFTGQVTTETIFYGDTPTIFTVASPNTGYLAGTNSYGDLGKYQKFYITKVGKLIEVNVYFGKRVIVGSADNFYVVVRGIEPDGSPSSTVYSNTYTTDIIDISNPGVVYNSFTIEPVLDINADFFVGIEWLTGTDDEIAIISDKDGEGESAKRAWEMWSDRTIHDIQTSWQGINIDLWISVVIQIVTDVDGEENSLPVDYALEQNYPNPFNPATTISYQIPASGQTTLKIFDLLGKEVATLVDSYQQAGRYQVMFNAKNLSSGIYFYRLDSGNFSQTKKLIMMK